MNATHTSHITEENVLDRLREPENIENPYPFYAHLRNRSPVLLVPSEGTAAPWVVPSSIRYTCLITGHAEARQTLQDEQIFRHMSDAENQAHIRESNRWPAMTSLAYRSVFVASEPRHNQMRRDLVPYFTPERFRAAMERRCDEALDRIKRRLQDGDTIDLNLDFAEVVPSNVLGDYLGVPESDRAALTRKVYNIFAAIDDVSNESMWEVAEKGVIDFLEYFGKLLEERRRNPRDDVASEIAHNNDLPDRGINFDGPGWTKVTFLTDLWLIGFFQIAVGLSNAMLRILEHPDKASSLLNGAAAVKDFIAESLRYDSPTRMTAPLRITTSDTMLGGVRVPAGTVGLVLLAAANRDPAVFPDPDRFLPGRDTSQMLTFGSGARSCIGRALTQMEMAIALPRLQAALPQLQLAGPVVRQPSIFTPYITRLPVSLAG